MRAIGLSLMILTAQLALADDLKGDRALIQQAAASGVAGASASQQSPAATPDKDDSLAADEQAARLAVAKSQAQLELVLARRALREERMLDAARAALRAQRALELAPGGLANSDEALQADGILARARKAGVDVDLLTRELEKQHADAGQVAGDELAQRSRAATRIAKRYDGAPHPDINTTPSARDLSRRALRNQLPDDSGYQPGKEIVDSAAINTLSQQRIMYEGVLNNAIREDAARLLTQVDETRVAPEGWVAYPHNWPQTRAKRARYENGMVARTPGKVDVNGDEWYLGVYDIHDLTYVPPDFNIPYTMNLGIDMQTQLDRAALRFSSQIFRGWPEDLAAGIPLLRYFGGVDDFAWRGPKYSEERRAEIEYLVEQFLQEREFQSDVQTVPALIGPVRP